MTRSCTVCQRNDVSKINSALIEGEPYRDIGARFGISTATICRHKQHIPEVLLKARGVRDAVQADDLLGQVDSLRVKTLRILERAERAEAASANAQEADRARRTALNAIKEVRGTLTLLAQLLGELRNGPTYNILISAEWLDLRTQILNAVEPYPEAKRAIIEAVSHAED